MEKPTCPMCGKPYRKGRFLIADCDHTEEEFRTWAAEIKADVVDVRTNEEKRNA